MNKYIAGYVRLSVRNTKSLSIDNQKYIIEDYCHKNNFDLFNIFVDFGYSGANFNRPQFKFLVNEIKNGNINILIVKDISRLGRNMYDVFYFLTEFLVYYNVRFISILDNYDSSVSDYFKSSLFYKNILNNKYLTDSIVKRKIVSDYNFNRGMFPGGVSPYGYYLDENRFLRVDFKTSLVIKLIFSLFISDISVSCICKILNIMGIPSPYSYKNYGENKWCKSTVYTILKKGLYKGDLYKNDTVIYNNHEKIVSLDVLGLLITKFVVLKNMKSQNTVVL